MWNALSLRLQKIKKAKTNPKMKQNPIQTSIREKQKRAKQKQKKKNPIQTWIRKKQKKKNKQPICFHFFIFAFFSLCFRFFFSFFFRIFFSHFFRFFSFSGDLMTDLKIN